MIQLLMNLEYIEWYWNKNALNYKPALSPKYLFVTKLHLSDSRIESRRNKIKQKRALYKDLKKIKGVTKRFKILKF